MAPITIAMLVLFGLLVVLVLALGIFYPGTGAEQLRWRPTRSPEAEAANEVEDVQQMLDAANERRRARGAPERSLADVERGIAADRAQREALRDRALADQEVDDLLALKNERRARKGLAPISRAEYESGLRPE